MPDSPSLPRLDPIGPRADAAPPGPFLVLHGGRAHSTESGERSRATRLRMLPFARTLAAGGPRSTCCATASAAGTRRGRTPSGTRSGRSRSSPGGTRASRSCWWGTRWAGEPPGDQVDDFELQDETGSPRRLSDLLARGLVVLFFYPIASSGGCTQEACHFRDLTADFAAVGAQPVGISSDSVAKQHAFATAHSRWATRCCPTRATEWRRHSGPTAGGCPAACTLDA